MLYDTILNQNVKILCEYAIFEALAVGGYEEFYILGYNAM
jgi:hypothetical protein